MRNKTYNEIIAYLRSFSNEHLDVQRFEEEDEDQMSSITSMDEKFPMIFVTPTGNEFDYELNGYTLRIYCYDRLMKDRSNSTNIRSKTNQILNDLDVWLRKESSLPFEIDEISNVTPFSSELMTDVTGWYIDLTIDVPSYSVCDIPFNTLPLIPTYDCDDNAGNYYLKCSDLIDCPTIIDIQEQIDNIPTGIDCDDLDNCQTIIDIKQSIIDIPTFDCDDLDNCQTIIDIKEDINNFFIAINFEDIEIFTYVVPESFKINTIDNPNGLVLDIKVNGLPYIIGNDIQLYDVVTILPNIIGFIKLNNSKL